MAKICPYMLDRGNGGEILNDTAFGKHSCWLCRFELGLKGPTSTMDSGALAQ